MTDEDDRRHKGERRVPSEKDETAMPRRAHDSSRVRAAIRTELEQVADENEDKLPDAGSQKRVIALEHISLAFEEPIIENVSFNATEGATLVGGGGSGT